MRKIIYIVGLVIFSLVLQSCNNQKDNPFWADGQPFFDFQQIFDDERLPTIQCFDFGQSELNDLDSVYPLAKEKKIPMVRIWVKKDDLLSGKIKDRFPTGVSLVYDANSFEEAKAVVKNYKNGT